MTYAQTYDHGSLFMNHMNAKAYMDNHHDDHAPISGFASGAIAMLPSIGISGITAGRNSFGAISASITTKYVNATIRNMALKTMGKMFAYNLVASAFDVAWGGFTDATGFDDSVYDFWRLVYGWLHI